jgi:ABC-type sugar transport system ATPase subunit
MVAVTLDRICKSFDGTEVLRDVSLTVEDRDFVAFVGPSGCGKSTLLRVIAGLETPEAGELRFGTRVMNAVPAPDRGAAMVFQSYALYPHMTVWENMSFSLRLQGVPREQRRARAAEVARLLQLDAYLDRRPGALSGGQRQRVAIGRALLRAPEVFLFDEPLSNLDAALRAEMRLELTRLHQTIGNTMIYVTHDQVEAMTMADRIVVLNKGEVMQVGAPMELYTRPATRFVAEFIGAPRMNLFEGTVTESGDAASFPGGGRVSFEVADLSPGSAVTVGLRPEALRPGEEGGAGIAAEVEVVEHLGAEALVYCKGELPGTVIARTEGTTALTPGDRVRLAYEPAAVHVFDGTGARVARPDAAHANAGPGGA